MKTQKHAAFTPAAAQEIRIMAVEPFLLHVPVTEEHVADSMHSLTHWGLPGWCFTPMPGCADTSARSGYANRPNTGN